MRLAGHCRGLALAIIATGISWQPGLGCALAKGPTRAVVAVLDGDTLLLDDHNKLRLVGALAPSPPNANATPGAWPPAAAAKSELERLVKGKSLMLQYDKRQTDRYGTQLAQTFVVDGDDSFWLQGRMVEQGLSRAYSLTDNHACAAELIGLENAARVLGLGLWANAAYQVRAADKPKDLLHYLGSLQLVEGIVVNANTNKGRVFLDFGTDWHEAFSVSIEPKDRQKFEKAGVNLTALKGHRVRVRGWIESSGHAQIRVTHPEQLELVEADGSAQVVAVSADIE